MAVEHGATVAANATKTVRLVIVAGESADPRIERARASGVQVVGVDEAERLVTAAIERAAAKHGLFDRGAGEVVAAELAEEKRQAHERPAWHEFWRARRLTTGEYRTRFVDPYEDADD